MSDLIQSRTELEREIEALHAENARLHQAFIELRDKLQDEQDRAREAVEKNGFITTHTYRLGRLLKTDDKQEGYSADLIAREAYEEIQELRTERQALTNSTHNKTVQLLEKNARLRQERVRLSCALEDAQAMYNAKQCELDMFKMNHALPRVEGLVLPGWTCTGCGVFNGACKETLVSCRACGVPKLPTPHATGP